MLSSKVVIISGGAQGIGRDTARGLFLEGADVVVGDVIAQEGTKLELEAAKEKEELLLKESKETGSITFFQYDARSKEGNAGLVEAAITKFGRVDVLVNNVGVQPKSSNVPVHELEEEVGPVQTLTHSHSLTHTRIHSAGVGLDL